MRYPLAIALTGLGLALSLGGCWPMLAVGAGAGGYYAGADGRPVTQISRDAMITAEVNSRLFGDSELSFIGIDVDTENGIVTLNGKVQNRTQYDKLIAYAREVRGVTGVVPNLTIVDPYAPADRSQMYPGPVGGAPVFPPGTRHPEPVSSAHLVPPTDPTVAYGYRDAYPNYTILVPKADGGYGTPNVSGEPAPEALGAIAPAAGGYAYGGTPNPNYNPSFYQGGNTGYGTPQPGQ